MASQSLLPTFKGPQDYLLLFSYEGPSFDGKMELHALAEELAGMEASLQLILEALRREGVFKINPLDFEFVVEPFQKGSFRKKIKLVCRKIEKYPAMVSLVGTVAVVFVGVGQIIATNNSSDVKNLSPQLISEVRDKVKLSLLSDDEFLKSINKVVQPLEDEYDSLRLIKPDESEYRIKYSAKQNFSQVAGEESELVHDEEETLVGRITRVDLTATKNVLGFKINDIGVTIPCSFLEALSMEARQSLLGKWVKINGVTSKTDKERKHITIYSFEIINAQEQGVIF